MKKPEVRSFKAPIIINLNKLIKENKKYSLFFNKNEIIKIYKSKRKNTVVVKDSYNKYIIKIEPEKTNILVIETSYDFRKTNILVIENSYDFYHKHSIYSGTNYIYINRIQLFKFDTFPENSPMVIAEPEYRFYTYIKQYYKIYIKVSDKTNVNLNSEYMIYFTPCYGDKSNYILTDQGLYSDTNYEITSYLLKNLGEREIILGNDYINEKIRVGDISLSINYYYNTENPSPISMSLLLHDCEIYLDNKIILKNFTNIVNKNIIKDMINYLNMIEKFVQNKELGFYGHCNLESKELLNFVPNEILQTIKLVANKYKFRKMLRETTNLNKYFKIYEIDKINEIDEVEITLKQGSRKTLTYTKVENKLMLEMTINGIRNTYKVKLLHKEAIKQLLKYLCIDKLSPNLYYNLHKQKKYYSQFLEEKK